MLASILASKQWIHCNEKNLCNEKGKFIAFIGCQENDDFFNLSFYCWLTVGIGQGRYISEIEKTKICSNVQFFMGNIMTWSKFANVSWLLRYSVFSILTKISWPIFLLRLWKNWAWINISETICGFGFIHRFQKWSNFWKLPIQQLTYEQKPI